MLPAAEQEANARAPGRVSSSAADEHHMKARISVSGDTGPSNTSTPRDSEHSAFSDSTSRSARGTALWLEPGCTVCFITSDGKLIGVRQASAESRDLSLVPVTSAASVQAGSNKRMQHFPTDSIFVVGRQV